MPGRLPPPLPKLGRAWSVRLGFELERYLKKIWHSLSGLQGAPSAPTDIEAGTASAAGSSQTPAPDDHQHEVDETGTVANIALTGGAGSGPGLARKTHVHGTPMTSNGDLLTVIGGVLDRLPVGSASQVLVVSGGLPAWGASAAGDPVTDPFQLALYGG